MLLSINSPRNPSKNDVQMCSWNLLRIAQEISKRYARNRLRNPLLESLRSRLRDVCGSYQKCLKGFPTENPKDSLAGFLRIYVGTSFRSVLMIIFNEFLEG